MNLNYSLVSFLIHGATVPNGPESPLYRGFTITLKHTTLVELLWTSDQPDAKTYA
jgi:hypothetical protein